MSGNQAATIIESDNPYLVHLAEDRRTLIANQPPPPKPSVRIAFLALIAIGEFIVGAASAINTAMQQQNASAQLGEIRSGLDALKRQVVDISIRLDQLIAEVASLLPAIQSIVNQVIYQSTVKNYLGLAYSAIQDITTFDASPGTAWQRIDGIKSALTKIQDSVNVIINAAPMTLDVALQVTPLISTWIAEWDMNEAIWRTNEVSHIVINARDHSFIKDLIVPSYSSLFDRCDQAIITANNDIANTTCPGVPDPNDFSLVYSFDRQNRVFTRASSFPPRPDLFRYEGAFGGLEISQNYNRSVVWSPAVLTHLDGTVQPNAKLDDPALGYDAWQGWDATSKHLRSCQATLSSLADHVNQRRKVMAALASL